ncbi:hypothetical protein KW805_01690 [Candidatus Pacearchaeota archaeon]|nr:hypothetical protein [Candidatus Pacearchaeota archaeon]
MEFKRGRPTVLAGIVMCLAFVAVLHTVVVIIRYGTGISGVYEHGVSGFSVGKTDLGEEITSANPSIPLRSKIILATEWAALVAIILFILVREKTDQTEEPITFNLEEAYGKSRTKTDLDVLYDILRERKHLRLSTICKLFKVKKELVIEWAEILERAELAIIDYPKLGEPVIKINETPSQPASQA